MCGKSVRVIRIAGCFILLYSFSIVASHKKKKRIKNVFHVFIKTFFSARIFAKCCARDCRSVPLRTQDLAYIMEIHTISHLISLTPYYVHLLRWVPSLLFLMVALRARRLAFAFPVALTQSLFVSGWLKGASTCWPSARTWVSVQVFDLRNKIAI